MDNVSCQDEDVPYIADGRGIWNSSSHEAIKRAQKHPEFYVSAVSQVSKRSWDAEGKQMHLGS
jgi:hypothetical protein